MSTKVISHDAVITKKIGDWTQITCRDLPESHHNHIVNIRSHLVVGTKGEVIYESHYGYGLLKFKETSIVRRKARQGGYKWVR